MCVDCENEKSKYVPKFRVTLELEFPESGVVNNATKTAELVDYLYKFENINLTSLRLNQW